MPETARRRREAPPRLVIYEPPRDASPAPPIELEVAAPGRYRVQAWPRDEFLAIPPHERPLDAFWDDLSGYYARYTPLGADGA